MSRSGYSDDCEHVGLWRAAVARALTGSRGQHFLRKLRDALDAMPVKRLITNDIADENGDVCALGSVDSAAPVDPEDREEVGKHFGIAPAMAAEIVYVNDECEPYRIEPDYTKSPGRFSRYKCFKRIHETPEGRWVRVRAWVENKIVPYEDD